jgi:uncharacterized protein YhbP (UPF0306 family)
VTGSGDLRAVLFGLLEACRVMTLATSGPRGPWAAPVLYAWEPSDPPSLYFMSRLGTRHVQDALRTGHAAAAIYPPETRPLRGVQMHGAVALLGGEGAARAAELYLRRFPSARGRFPVEDVLEGHSEIRFFCFRPEQAFVLSEPHFGWGVRREVPLGVPATLPDRR